mgnify:CR=1 FL=1
MSKENSSFYQQNQNQKKNDLFNIKCITDICPNLIRENDLYICSARQHYKDILKSQYFRCLSTEHLKCPDYIYKSNLEASNKAWMERMKALKGVI